MRVFTGILMFLLFTVPIFGQGNSVTVYTEIQKGDSVESAVELLFTELKKSINRDYSLRSPAAFNNEGFIILTTKLAEKYKINFPSQLKLYGSEGIYISGNARTTTIIANTGLGLREAVYFYLEHLGFHYYLPGDKWKIVPVLATPFKKISLLTKPDYEYRKIGNGHAFGNSSKLFKEFYSWYDANCLGGAFQADVSHSYEEIVQRNADLFKQHPEYFAKPPPAGTLPIGEFKFNVANKELVDFIVKDAFFRYERQKRVWGSANLLSMDPSDGGGFCTTPACKAIGTPSDQAFYLSNAVAKAFQKKYPNVWIGSYAYNEHILPTKYKLEPNIFVVITNGFNRTTYTTEELIRIWRQKAKKVGVYDYLSVYEWDNEMPGRIQAAKIDYLKSSLQKFYSSGARVYLGETTIGWVSRGPGQYVLSKLLWNLKVNTDSLLNDFFSTAFENSAPLIKKLYARWENYPRNTPADNDMAEWLNIVNDAYKTAKTDIVRERIDAIKLYMNYLVLYVKLRKESTEENLQKTLSFAHRNFENASFATFPILVSLPLYSGFKGQGWYDGTEQKWRNDKQPYTNLELQQSFQEALRTFKRTEGMISFPTAKEFVKLSSIITLPEKRFNSGPHAAWFKTEYIVQINNKSPLNYFELTSDFSAQMAIAKPVTVKIYPLKQTNKPGSDVKPILEFEQFKKQQKEKFSLASLNPGTYRLILDDLRKIFILTFSKAIHYSIVADLTNNINTTTAAGLNTFYFYVPENVKRFQITKTSGFMLETPTGRKIDKRKSAEETFTVDVLPYETGIWTISQQGGSISLEGVPPFLGDHPTTMLVPSYLKK